MGCGMVVCALLVSLLVIMGASFFGKEDPYGGNVRAFLIDVKLETGLVSTPIAVGHLSFTIFMPPGAARNAGSRRASVISL
jgi:hypothetical protein